MAGYDGGNDTSHPSCNLIPPPPASYPTSPASPSILAVIPTQLDFSMDLNSDGDCSDTGENLSYYIYTSSGVDKLGRSDNHALPVQAVAENFRALEFTYLDSSQTPTATLTAIRSVQVSILAEARRPDSNYTDTKIHYTPAVGAPWGPYGDNLRRRFQAMTVKCRNLWGF